MLHLCGFVCNLNEETDFIYKYLCIYKYIHIYTYIRIYINYTIIWKQLFGINWKAIRNMKKNIYEK